MIDILGLGSVAEILVSLPLSVKMKVLFMVSLSHEYQIKAPHMSSKSVNLGLLSAVLLYRYCVVPSYHRLWHISKVVLYLTHPCVTVKYSS